MASGGQGKPRSMPQRSQTPRQQQTPTPRLTQRRPIAARPDVATPPMGQPAAPTVPGQTIRPRGTTP